MESAAKPARAMIEFLDVSVFTAPAFITDFRCPQASSTDNVLAFLPGGRLISGA
jgi:hypothetical protein